MGANNIFQHLVNTFSQVANTDNFQVLIFVLACY